MPKSTVPPAEGMAEGRLEVRLDGQRHAALSLALTLGAASPGVVGHDAAGAGTAYVGFTASTGEASERHDIRAFSYCHKLGCAVL